MGFFDSLKEGAQKLANRVTGGYGNILFEIGKDHLTPGEMLPFNITVTATGDLEAKRVVIYLRGTEDCEMTIRVNDGDSSRDEDHSISNKTMEQTFNIFGELKMKEGESKNFNGEIEIPADCLPTYIGPNARHTWTLEANVDVPWGRDLTQTMNIVIR